MPPGLRRSDAILQTTFDVETPSEQVRLVVVRTEVWTADATARACTKPFATGAEVEVALVDPGAFDSGDDLGDRLPDRSRVLLVERMPRAEEHGVRAAAQCLRGAHRGVNAERTRRVVRRRDDASAVRVAADDERLLTQLRILELLDRCEERVEVDVSENRHRGKARCPNGRGDSL